MTFRITFNKPTIAGNFQGEKQAAVRVKIEDGIAMFLPVPDMTMRDALPITLRGRGGGEAIIEGSRADELKAALTNASGPFFVLQRQKGGWLAALPWAHDSAPPKPEPHLRVWEPEKRSAALAQTKEVSEITLENLLNQVTSARQTVMNYETQRRVGRPSNEVTEARRVLNLFDRMVEESAVTPKMKTDRRSITRSYLRSPIGYSVTGASKRPARLQRV